MNRFIVFVCAWVLMAPTCERPYSEFNKNKQCGNGVVNLDEECDDGNRDDGDYCAADCDAVWLFVLAHQSEAR